MNDWASYSLAALASAAAGALVIACLRGPTRVWRRQLAYRRGVRRNQRFWAAVSPGPPRPSRLRIIASLTTSPSRLALLEPVLASLTRGQTRPPDEIHLNLPWKFGRTGETYELPDFLSRYPVQVFRMEDVGPATKLVPTLERISDPDTWILTVDDDIRHLPTAVERLEDAAVADPAAAHGFSDYALWRKWRPGKPVDFLAGVGGVLYRRGFFGPDFPAYFRTACGHRSCFFQDDIVFSNYLALRQVRRWRVSVPDCSLALMKTRGCALEQAGGADALSHGAGSGLDTKSRSLEAIAFLREAGLAGPRVTD